MNNRSDKERGETSNKISRKLTVEMNESAKEKWRKNLSKNQRNKTPEQRKIENEKRLKTRDKKYKSGELKHGVSQMEIKVLERLPYLEPQEWKDGFSLDFFNPRTKKYVELNGIFYHIPNKAEKSSSRKYINDLRKRFYFGSKLHSIYFNDKDSVESICKIIETSANEIDNAHYLNNYKNNRTTRNYEIFEINNRALIKFPWDDKNKFNNLLDNNGDKTRHFARNLQIKELTKKECDDFLIEHHLQKSCKGQNIKLALVGSGEILQIMTFGKPRYNKKFEYELLRLCTRTNNIIIGGAEKLFKHFVEQYEPKNIISYCDVSKFSGRVYERLGFSKPKTPKPSKHWFNENMPEQYQHFTDNLLKQKGFDQLVGKYLGFEFGKGVSNEELMRIFDYGEIYDKGQATYVYENQERK